MSMSSYAKMAMMRRGQSGPRNAYDGGMGGAYNRVTDRNVGGRPVDDTGGKVYDRPAEGNYGVENRRDSRGRYAPRNAYEGGQYRMGHDDGWVVKPIHQEMGNRYRMGDDGGRMIGFDGGDMRGGYRMEAHYGREDELGKYRKQKQGHAHSDGGGFDRKKAQEWTREMKNADGSSGEHWTFEQTSQAMKQRGVECDPVEFYATMNMLWSDYGAVAKKYGVDKLEFWAELSKAFLMDEDAEEGKLELYYECIVGK